VFLDAPVLRTLVNRYHVDARIHRKLPAALRDTGDSWTLPTMRIAPALSVTHTHPFRSATDARSSIPRTPESFANQPRSAWCGG